MVAQRLSSQPCLSEEHTIYEAFKKRNTTKLSILLYHKGIINRNTCQPCSAATHPNIRSRIPHQNPSYQLAEVNASHVTSSSDLL